MNAPFDSETISVRLAPRKAAIAWADALAATAAIADRPERLLSDVITGLAETHGNAAALLSDVETFTFSSLAGRINQYRHWARSIGLAKGDTVALMLGNRPDYVAIWLGLSKEGIAVALLNTSLRGQALTHCIAAAAPRHIIAEEQFALFFDRAIPLSIHGQFAHDMARSGPMDGVAVRIDDKALLIYTSGTTGLPKAAIVSHRRLLNWAFWFKGLLGNTEADRIYNCLPLYHSVGGVVAVAATLVAGGSTVIASKFSASRFWSDIRRWDCTQFQYIGELCRYLLAQPASIDDGHHRVRLACGNGLRGDIWEAFTSRFKLPQVFEFYAATEATFSLYNAEGQPGAIGRIPPYLRHRFKVALVKHNVETGMPERGGNGMCIEVAAGETGEALGFIAEGAQFEGYTNAGESSRKVLRNVQQPGDRWFRTGDLMRMDRAGYYYFVDRIGDTFRWKGENVSTLEVANVLTQVPGVVDAVVYGVTLPFADGRAGMAYIDVESDFDVEGFARHVTHALAPYARPLFLRLGSGTAMTETFKHQKATLQSQGFDPRLSSDGYFVLIDGRYRSIDESLFAAITSGTVRL